MLGQHCLLLAADVDKLASKTPIKYISTVTFGFHSCIYSTGVAVSSGLALHIASFRYTIEFGYRAHRLRFLIYLNYLYLFHTSFILATILSSPNYTATLEPSTLEPSGPHILATKQ